MNKQADKPDFPTDDVREVAYNWLGHTPKPLDNLREVLTDVVGGGEDLVEYTDGGIWVTDKALKLVLATVIDNIEAGMGELEEFRLVARDKKTGTVLGPLGKPESYLKEAEVRQLLKEMKK